MSSFTGNAVSGVVDEWLKGDSKLAAFAEDVEDVPTLLATDGGKSRVGLGFGPGNTSQDGSRVKEDVLLNKIKKSNKRKREEDNTPAPVISHGLADDDDEEMESKIKVVSTLGKKQDTTPLQPSKKSKGKAVVVSSSSETGKAPVAVASEGSAENEAKESKAVVFSPINKGPQLKGKGPQSEGKPTNVTTGSETVDASAGGESKSKNKRKKIKTRSKQKNIRRDNRTEDQRPDHLKIGNKGYKGRPVSYQTKQILGIPDSSSKHIKIQE